MKTQELIKKLSNEQSKEALKAPKYYTFFLLAIMVIYAIFIQFYLGLRSDLLAQMLRTTFLLEIFLLVSLSVASAVALVLLIYPDHYQKIILIIFAICTY